MPLDLAGMRVALGRRVRQSLDTTAATDAINAALEEIAASQSWPWLDETDTFTCDSSESYDLPDDWEDTRTVTIDEAPATQVAVGDIDRWDTWTARPEWAFAIDEDQLLIRPLSDSAEVIHRYRVAETVLTSDTDVPRLPASLRRAAVVLAAMHHAGDMEDTNKYEALRREWQGWEQKLLLRLYTGQSRIPRSRGW